MSKWYERTISAADIIFGVVTIPILTVVSISYIWVLVNIDALKALVEAEATILGFFGIIAVYWLTSLDSRIDRLEQEKHEYKMRKKNIEANRDTFRMSDPVETFEIPTLEAEVTSLETRIEKIQTLKEGVTNEASVIGIFLVISLVASIGLLGFQSTYADALKNLNSPLARLICIAAGIPTMIFLESIWFIFSLLRRMSKKPKQE